MDFDQVYLIAQYDNCCIILLNKIKNEINNFYVEDKKGYPLIKDYIVTIENLTDAAVLILQEMRNTQHYRRITVMVAPAEITDAFVETGLALEINNHNDIWVVKYGYYNHRSLKTLFLFYSQPPFKVLTPLENKSLIHIELNGTEAKGCKAANDTQ